MNKIYHVSVFLALQERLHSLSKLFDLAQDWILYAPNCWIICTDIDASEWRARLKREAGSGGQVLLLEINGTGQVTGTLREDVWKWLENHGLSVDRE